jgi:hypothetical protein
MKLAQGSPGRAAMFRTKKSAIRAVGLLLLLLIGLIVPIRGSGIIAKARLEYLFTNPDGTPCDKPCLLGIKPRGTPFRTATGILRRHPMLKWMDDINCNKDFGFCSFELRYYGAKGTIAAFDVSRDQPVIQDIYLSFDNGADAPVLGDMINLLGTALVVLPHYDCCDADDLPAYLDKLERFGPTYGVTLYYPALGIEITDRARLANDEYALRPASPVMGFRIFKPYPICTRASAYWDRWHGFVSLADYFDQPYQRCNAT